MSTGKMGLQFRRRFWEEDDRIFVGFIEGIHYPPGPPPLAIPTAEGLAPGDPASRLFEL